MSFSHRKHWSGLPSRCRSGANTSRNQSLKSLNHQTKDADKDDQMSACASRRTYSAWSPNRVMMKCIRSHAASLQRSESTGISSSSTLCTAQRITRQAHQQEWSRNRTRTQACSHTFVHKDKDKNNLWAQTQALQGKCVRVACLSCSDLRKDIQCLREREERHGRRAEHLGCMDLYDDVRLPHEVCFKQSLRILIPSKRRLLEAPTSSQRQFLRLQFCTLQTHVICQRRVYSLYRLFLTWESCH